MSAVKDTKTWKAELRAEIRIRRKALPDRQARSRRAIWRLVNAEFWSTARTILVYASAGSELETDVLIQKILADTGKICVVPYCLPDGKLGLFRLENIEELAPGKYGIREPSAAWKKRRERRISADAVDLVVLPALALDAHGYRLDWYSRVSEFLLFLGKRMTFRLILW